MIVKITNVRICFCANLFTPAQIMSQGDLKHSATFLIPKEDMQVPKIRKSMADAAVEKWGDKGHAIMNVLTDNKVFLRNGDTKAEYDGFDGNMFFNATRPAKTGAPLIINADKTELQELDGVIYAGCYVDVSIEVYAQDNQHGKRINCRLRAIRFRREGEALSGSAPAKEDEFDDLSDVGAGSITPGATEENSSSLY